MGGGENDGILIKCIKPNGVPQHILREGSERRTKITRFCDRAHFCGKPPKTIEETTGFARCCATTAFLDARPETLQTRGVIAFSGMVPRPATFSYLGGLELISTPKRAPGKIHFAGKHPKPLINYGVRKVLRNACFCGCPAGKSWKPTGFIAVSGWGRRFVEFYWNSTIFATPHARP